MIDTGNSCMNFDSEMENILMVTEGENDSCKKMCNNRDNLRRSNDDDDDDGDRNNKRNYASMKNSAINLHRFRRTRKLSKLMHFGMMCSISIYIWMFACFWIQNVDGSSNDRAERLLYQNRHWTGDDRSAIATIERASKPIIFPNDQDNHLQPTQFQPSNLQSISGRTSANSGPSLKDDRIGRIELSPIPSGSIGTFRFPSEVDSNDVSIQGRRTGRVMNSSGEPAKNATKKEEKDASPSSRESQQQKPSSESSSAESSRKASPDVQDIIDGIVKLLGGKVHNGTPPGAQVQGQRVQQQQPVSPNPAYNLFNPTKPIFFPTAKPTRINNRGPPLPGGGVSNPPLLSTPSYTNSNPISNNNNINYNNNQPMQSSGGGSFEAIPLEALNTDFNLNKSNFGPPFPLNKAVPSGTVVAPYKNGIPLPEQLVPTNNGHNNNLNFDRYQNQNGQSHPYNNNNNNQQPYGNFNNNNYNNYGTPGSTIQPYSYPPTTTSQGTPSPRPQPQQQRPTSKRPTTSSSLLVPVTNKPKPERLPPVTLPEDDEADDLRFTTNVNLEYNKTLQDSEVNLEPTVTEAQGPSLSPEFFQNPNKLEGTLFEFSQLPSSHRFDSNDIKPTSTAEASPGIYPTLVLETNSDNGFVEIVTRYSTVSAEIKPSEVATSPPSASRPPVFYPNSNLNKQVLDYNKHSSTSTTKAVDTITSTTGTSTTTNPLTSNNPLSIHALPTPPLRPGIVISDAPSTTGGGQGVGSVEVVTALDGQSPEGQVGEVFDVTVTAKQSYGGQVTGQPFVVPVVLKDDVITAPEGNQQFVSIDGKRTYFNLHPNTAAAGILPSRPTQTVTGTILPVLDEPVVPPTANNNNDKKVVEKPKPNQNIGVGSVGAPVPLLPQPPGKTLFNSNTPNRPISTSLSISPGSSSGSGDKGVVNKTPPNIIRRPLTRRPSIPPVRIDTCIVGDDSTCNSEQYEVCRTENGVSSCICRSGYARRRHREPCKAIVSLVMSIKLDKLGDKKLSYNPDYFNPNSEIYQSIEWETIHALDSSMGETTLSGGYVGSKLDAIGFDGKHAVVNTTVLIQDNAKMPASQLKRELQKQMIQVLTRNRNNFGKSQLWVEGPISAVSAITDLDECEDSDMHDCHSKAKCVNTLGSFECKCEPGYGDPYEDDKRRSGRKCETCNGKTHCNGRGECLVDNGQKVCKCQGNYYGSQCDIDGEVLAVAIGASVSAVVIIGLTLACLCMWSRKWKKEEQKAALMSRTLFGGMATQALSYLGGKSTNPYQQHVSMDERLRWAQVADNNMTGNIYVQNEPMSMHTSPALMGQSMMETPPMMSARRSADTADTTVDDMFDERQPGKRPRSRSSQMQGGIYYDLEPEPQSEIYASRSMMHFPAQFCVPMTPMGHYAHTNRGFYT